MSEQAKVDVLAVLDFHIANMEGAGRLVPQRDELIEVRAAVAALIAQAEKADAMLHNVTEAYVPEQHRAAWQADAADLRAALAQVSP